MISKSLSTSKKRAALHQVVPDLAEFCQQLFPLLVAHADDFGRLSGDAFTVKHAIDPTSPRPLADFERALQALHDVDLVVWYQVADEWILQIVKFEPHQTGLHKRTTSHYPAPGDSQSFPEIPSEEKRTELNRSTASAEPPRDSTPPASRGSVETRDRTQSPTFLEFPTIGKGGPTWCLTEAQLAEWTELFPGLDLRAESRHALAWVKADPGRRKTAGRGMEKFLTGWFTRSVNSGRARSAMTGTPDTAPARDDSARKRYGHLPVGGGTR